MQPLAPGVLGISKTPWVFGQLVNSRSFFSKPENLVFDIHGNLGKHLKPFDHTILAHWLGLGVRRQIIHVVFTKRMCLRENCLRIEPNISLATIIIIIVCGTGRPDGR